ncbi:MAG: WD40 repeat domain-containing serine/threonine-protein kinase, partial [Planctomycetaceae bacterium]
MSCPNCGSALPDSFIGPTRPWKPDPDDFVEGRMVAHFELKERLGGGGFGEVWLAQDHSLNRDVALKFPKSQYADPSSLLREARTAASLKHPHIVAIHEVNHDKGRVFIASDFVKGLTLRDILSKGRLSLDQVHCVLQPIIRALHYAHEQGVIHRDIKPGNILVDRDNHPWVTDFGIAKVIQDDETKTFDGQIIGTAKYMSPEQAEGKTSATDRRADIYSLGVLLFEMLTGEVPFRGSPRAILNQKINEDAPSPRRLVSKLHRDLETICLRCLERDPGKRYQTAAALADELKRQECGEPILARPITQVERLWRWCKRRKLVAALLVGLIVSLSSGLTGVTVFWLKSEHHAEQLRNSLYRSKMSLISSQLLAGDVVGTRTALDGMEKDPQLDGLRGFEFGYCSQLVSPLKQVANYGELVEGVALSRDGDLCASFGKAHKIRVWDTASGEEIRALSIDKGRFRSIDFSPSRGYLASADSDGLVRIWNPRQDARMIEFFEPGGQILRVRYSSNGRWLLAMSTKGPVRIFSANNHFEKMVELPCGPSNGRDARFIGDGSRVVIATNDGQFRLYSWSDHTFELQQSLDSLPAVQAIAVSDDEKLLAAGSYNGGVQFWDLETGELIVDKLSYWGRIDAIEFLENSHIAAFVPFSSKTHFMDPSIGAEVMSLTTHGLMQAVVARSGNGQKFVFGNNDGSLLQLEVSQLQMPDVLWHDAPIEAVAFVDNGQHLIAADFDPATKSGELRVWDLSTGQHKTLPREEGQPVNCLAIDTEQQRLATGGLGRAVLIRSTVSWEMTDRIPVDGGGTAALQFCPRSGRLAILSRAGKVSIHDPADWETTVWKPQVRSAGVTCVRHSPDGDVLAIGWDDGLVRCFDADSGSPVGRELQITGVPTVVCFCEQGAALAVGVDSGDLIVGDWRSGQLRKPIRAHLARVSALDTLENGTVLVSGG